MNTKTKNSNFKKKTSIRSGLLKILIPIAIVPLLFVIIFVSMRIYTYLENQANNYYNTLLSQVSANIDFVYKQYALTITNMFKISIVKNTLQSQPYTSKEQERVLCENMYGTETIDFGLRKTAQEKIDGYAYIYEIDRKSLIDKTNYKLHYLNDNSGRPVDPYYEKLLKDPLFLKVKQNNNIRLVFGKLQNDTIPGIDGDKKTVFIFPYYPNPPQNPNDTFSKFMLIVLHKDFIPNFYKKINPLKFGTLYILDKFNNIIAYNHPATSKIDHFDDSDYYEYDEKTKNYVLTEGDEKNPKDELLKFEDYTMLNSDFNILKESSVLNILQKEDVQNGDEINYKKEFVTYKGKTFLTIFKKSDISGTKFIYFHPIKQLQKPIFEIISILFILAIIVILLVIIISIRYSTNFTDPIKLLVEATQIVAKGNYSHLIGTPKNNNEINDLTDNFNLMIRNIKSYQDKLLSAEREKSELELASRIQTCLLPELISNPFYEMTAIMFPASEVGGDYYDIIGEQNGRVWFGIGDVSGHGLTSGLIMMMAQTAFNTILLNNPNIASSDLISEVNKVMYQNIKQRLGEDHFMTLSFMVAEPDGNVRYSGAHLDLLIYRKKTKKAERVGTFGIWLGLLPDIKESTNEQSFKLESGDLFLLYTDGLIEAKNKENEQYDMGRLVKKLEEYGDKANVKDIEDEIIKDVFNFLNEQKDDITIVIARKK